MSIKSIFIRVDASLEIGTGHVMRCLTLADALRLQGDKCTFICREHKGSLIGLIEDRGYTVIRLSAKLEKTLSDQEDSLDHSGWLGTSQIEDATETKLKLCSESVDWIVVDHYALDCNWEGQLNPICKKMIAIDDLADRKHLCDLLIDQTLGRQSQDYKDLVPEHCRILTGVPYALLRPEFAALRRQALTRAIPTLPVRVLVSMGGFDQSNATLAVLKVLIKIPKLFIQVLLSSQSAHYSSVASFCQQHRNISHNDFSDNMTELMLNSDIAIGGAGATSWERACLGLPCVAIVLADNQAKVSKELNLRGAVAVVELEHLASSLMNAFSLIMADWKSYHVANLTICDGLGVNRVLIELNRLSQLNQDRGRNCQLLPASEKDIEIVYKWQHQPLIRLYALNPDIPSWNDHYLWMKEKITSSKDFFYIATAIETEQKLGVVRLDYVQDNRYIVSIYTDPARHGEGIALSSLNMLDKLFPDIYIMATVMLDNKASQRLFERAGFQRIDSESFVRKPIFCGTS